MSATAIAAKPHKSVVAAALGAMPRREPQAQACWHHTGAEIKRIYKNDWSNQIILAEITLRQKKDPKTGKLETIETKTPLVMADVQVVARGGDVDGRGWGIVVSWHDPNGAEHIEALRDLSPDKVSAVLNNGGAWVSPETKHRQMFVHWLQSAPVAALAVLRNRTGWIDDGQQFVQPDGQVTGTRVDGKKVFFVGSSRAAKGWQVRGDLAAWQAAVGPLCQASDRAMFAVCAALAAPLLQASGEPSGGFVYVGESGNGKTTALRAGTSVWAHPVEFEKGFDMSAAGPEALASAHGDLFLPLDEMGRAQPDAVQKVIYTLANGTGRARSGVGGDLRDVAAWRILFFATSEKTVNDLVAASHTGGTATAGVEYRLIEIPSRGAAGGIFDRVADGQSRDKIISGFYQAVRSAHGIAGQKWLEWLCTNAAALVHIPAQVDAMRDTMTDAADSAQTRRALRRFALLAVAAALAEAAGILPASWGAVEAVRSVVQGWKATQPTGNESGETVKARKILRDWIEANQAARMTARLREAADGPATRPARIEVWGYLDFQGMDSRVFLTPAAFDAILQKANLNPKLCKAALTASGDIIRRGGRIDEKAPSGLDKSRVRVIELRADLYAPPRIDEILE